jgi:tRNA G18 (ribose-2'-O)-methylase SpoU
MPNPSFETRECVNPDCAFRFPISSDSKLGDRCPRCGSQTRPVECAYPPARVPEDLPTPGGPPVEAILDNIRSAWNVGAMFRTADGAGLARLHLCGVTPTPGNPKTAKTALGAERNVPWSYYPNAVVAAQNLVSHGLRLWALEGGPASTSIFDIGDISPAPLALVVGNEVSGVDPQVLAMCDRVVFIPMQGFKRSLNVAIAFGVAVYTLRYNHTEIIDGLVVKKRG